MANVQSDIQPGTAYFQFERGRDPLEGMSPISRWMSQAYEYTDLSASQIFLHLPPGTMLMKVVHRVDAVLTGCTDILIGDGDAANGWITTGIITPGTAGDTVTDPTSVNHALGVKRYPTGDVLTLAFAGVVTAGAGIVFAEVISYAEALEAEL